MKIAILVLTTLLVGCNVQNVSSPIGNSEIGEGLKSYPVSELGLYKIDKTKYTLPEPKGNLPDYNLEQWVPELMGFKGKLEKKWVIQSPDLSKNISLNNVQSMPDGWRINTYPIITQVNDVIINPVDGKLNRPIKFGKNSIWMGLFADKYIFASDDSASESKIVCIDGLKWNKYWRNGWEAMPSDQHIMIVNGCLIDCYFGPMFVIQRFDQRTGETTWGLRCNATGSRDFKTRFTNDERSLFVLNTFECDIYDKGTKKQVIGKEYRLILYKINPVDGSFVSKDLYYYTSSLASLSTPQIHFSKGNLWIPACDGILLKVNPVNMELVGKYDLKDTNTNNFFLSGDYLIFVNNDLLGRMINLDDPSRIVDIEQKFDIVTDRLQNFYPKYSGQLIIYSTDRISQITDDKMSTGWYIDASDLGLEPLKTKVIMQDWRGVLVLAGNQLICFGKP